MPYPRKNPYASFLDVLNSALSGYVQGTQYKQQKVLERDFLKARTRKLDAEFKEGEMKRKLLESVLPSLLSGDENSPVAGPLAKGMKALTGGQVGPPAGAPSSEAPWRPSFMQPAEVQPPMRPVPGPMPVGPSPVPPEVPAGPSSVPPPDEPPTIYSPTEGPRKVLAERKTLSERMDRYRKTNLALKMAGAEHFYKDMEIREINGQFFAIDPNRGMEMTPISERTAKSFLDEQKSEIDLSRAKLSFARELEQTERGYTVPAAKDVDLWIRGEDGEPRMVKATQMWDRMKNTFKHVGPDGNTIDPDTIVPAPGAGEEKTIKSHEFIRNGKKVMGTLKLQKGEWNLYYKGQKVEEYDAKAPSSAAEGGEVKARKLAQARQILADRMLPFALQNNPDLELYGATPNRVLTFLSQADQGAWNNMMRLAEENLEAGFEPAQAVQMAFEQHYRRRPKGKAKAPAAPITPEEALAELRRRGVPVP